MIGAFSGRANASAMAEIFMREYFCTEESWVSPPERGIHSPLQYGSMEAAYPLEYGQGVDISRSVSL